MPNAVYDITTLTGQVRFHAADTNVTLVADDATFSDAEIAYALTVGLQNAQLAAAWLLDSLAADGARLAFVIEKTQGVSVDRKTLAAELAARAQSLRDNALVGGSIDAPDLVFSTDDTADATFGTMDGW